jgi:hypothetical protein
MSNSQTSTPILIAGFFLAGVMLLLNGCGSRQTINYDRPEMSHSGHWETAWVDPQMILSDTLFTLIRSYRVDSFFVDTALSTDPTPVELHFYVDASECFVAISVTDNHQDILLPLIAETLTHGYYKFTFYSNRLDPKYLDSPALLLKAFYCGRTRIEPIEFR